jgi:FAD/FMN-containing dehydrogenase
MWADYLDEVRSRLPAVRQPLGGSPAFAILLEVESNQGAERSLADFLEQAIANNRVNDGVLAQSQSQAEEFWALRDAVAQLLQIYQRSMAFDVSLPLTTLQAYSDAVARSLQAEFPGMTALRFAHLGDGTLHYIIDAPDAASKARILELVLAPLASHDGAVSAEHGIGVAKRDYLHLSRCSADIEQMRKLKALLDPRAILNPGRVFS